MRIIVLGSGAIGSILAAHLSSAGADVTLVARGPRADYLRNHGITIAGLANLNEHCRITTQPKELREADFLIVAVKTYDMASALDDVSHLTINAALSVQNGVLKNEQLARIFGEDKVMGAVAILSGELTSEGPVRFTLNENLFLGEFPEGTSLRVDQLVTCLETSGVHAKAVPNIQTIDWSKFVSWVGLMSLSILTRMETHKFLLDANTSLISVRIMRETAMLAERYGVPLEDSPTMPAKTIVNLSESEAVRKLHEVGAIMKLRAPGHKVSSLQDLEKGKPLEVEETLGYVVRNAAQEQISVPTVETVYHLISGLSNHAISPSSGVADQNNR